MTQSTDDALAKYAGRKLTEGLKAEMRAAFPEYNIRFIDYGHCATSDYMFTRITAWEGAGGILKSATVG